MKNKTFPFFLLCGLSCSIFLGCSKFRSDPSKITMRPRVFMEGAAPIPILDEYDFRGVQLGTIANILTPDPSDRTYTLWFTLDRRSAMTLQKIDTASTKSSFSAILLSKCDCISKTSPETRSKEYLFSFLKLTIIIKFKIDD